MIQTEPHYDILHRAAGGFMRFEKKNVAFKYLIRSRDATFVRPWFFMLPGREEN